MNEFWSAPNFDMFPEKYGLKTPTIDDLMTAIHGSAMRLNRSNQSLSSSAFATESDSWKNVFLLKYNLHGHIGRMTNEMSQIFFWNISYRESNFFLIFLYLIWPFSSNVFDLSFIRFQRNVWTFQIWIFHLRLWIFEYWLYWCLTAR